MKTLQAELKAIDLAIEALREIQRQFSPGHVAYGQGIRADEIVDGEVSGTGFAWAEEDHKAYIKYDKAINRLADLKEILTDPPVTHQQERLL